MHIIFTRILFVTQKDRIEGREKVPCKGKYGVLFKSVIHNEMSFLYITNFICSRVNEMCGFNIQTF